MTFTTTLLDQSIEKATDIFMQSENLSVTRVNADMYVERIPYLADLLGAEGKVSFNPFVTKDVVDDFRKHMSPATTKLHNQYYGTSFSDWDVEKPARDAYYLANCLHDNLTNEDLISNKLSANALVYIKDYEMKGYSSPKLSKILVKLFGEQSDVVKWFTNDCPKKLDKGLNKDYRVHLSILPHHIAGMAYYAPFNWEGKRWLTGWNNTSCMDTIRNTSGGGIYQLPPSLLDGTLAIAYLTEEGNDDDLHPIYQARMLVRVVKVNDSDYVMLGARSFYTSNETKNILIEGLKSEFDNFVHADDLRRNHDIYSSKTFKTPMDTQWTVTKGGCEHCSDGYDDDGDECGSCEGDDSENEVTYSPYIDDPDFVSINTTNVQVKLPTKWLIEKGYIEEPKKGVLPSTPCPSLVTRSSLVDYSMSIEYGARMHKLIGA